MRLGDQMKLIRGQFDSGLVIPIGLIALVFITFIALAVVSACQLAGKLGHLVPQFRRILIFAAFIDLFRHYKPSF
jgi:hypothetical protein